jgi:hypothetical protein
MHEEITFDEFISRFAPVKDYLPLDFSYEKEDKCFYIDLVVLWRLMDAFILHPRLRSFIKITVETPEQYQVMIQFLKTGRDHVVKYLDEHLEDCQEEGF